MWKFVVRTIEEMWKCFSNMGDNGKKILKVCYIPFCAEIDFSNRFIFHSFAEILPRKLETRFLFRPSLILKNRDWKVPFVESNWWR